MAHMTLEGGRAEKYRLSLGGIYAPLNDLSTDRPFKMPPALETFLKNHPDVTELEICTDNDAAGRWAALQIAKHYSGEYRVKVNLPPKDGYDWADMAKEEKQERAARHRVACFIKGRVRKDRRKHKNQAVVAAYRGTCTKPMDGQR